MDGKAWLKPRQGKPPDWAVGGSAGPAARWTEAARVAAWTPLTEMDPSGVLTEALPTLVQAAGVLARFCDRTEHNEQAERSDVLESGAKLRLLAVQIFGRLDLDPAARYYERLQRVEARYPSSGVGSTGSAELRTDPETWRHLQQVQAVHDAIYHPDVAGLPKLEQLRHYTLHVAKLAWLTQQAADDQALVGDYLRDRLPDLLLFGIKLATVVGLVLPDDPVAQS